MPTLLEKLKSGNWKILAGLAVAVVAIAAIGVKLYPSFRCNYLDDCPPPPFYAPACEQQTSCPADEADEADEGTNELMVQLLPGITQKMVESSEETIVQVCYDLKTGRPVRSKTGISRAVADRKPIIISGFKKSSATNYTVSGQKRRYFDYEKLPLDKDSCRYIVVSKPIFIDNLNYLLRGMVNPNKTGEGAVIDDFKVTKSCDCSWNVMSIELIPEDLFIEEKILANSSPPRKQGNGILGAIGVNRDLRLSIIPPSLDQLASLPAADDCEEVYGVITNNADFKRGAWKDNIPADTAGDAADCEPTYLPLVSDPSTVDRVKVGFVDTGMDLGYDYRQGQYLAFVFPEEWGEDEEVVDLASVLGLGAEKSQQLNKKDCTSGYGYDFFEGDGYVNDEQGHGTHLASLILSGESPIQVIPYKVGGLEGERDKERFRMDLFSAVCAIHKAVDDGVDVLNLSWGFYADSTSMPLENAIARAVDAGIIIVTSAGNDTVNVEQCTHWPSAYNQQFPGRVLSVGALNANILGEPTDFLAEFSNYGDGVDVFAPGHRVSGAMRGTEDAMQKLSGTSMAAALMTRFVAENLAAFNGNNGEIPVVANNEAGFTLTPIDNSGTACAETAYLLQPRQGGDTGDLFTRVR